ncbi:Late embryogenesis abundant protein domain-containing protein [Forsythia ovata]|uniref:Late embryogenesis abundant protein domain-containing protein n=1 Tax=Forsythia ovata TaxID=205694 RepID=A0ABD1X0U5_9LAMI
MESVFSQNWIVDENRGEGGSFYRGEWDGMKRMLTFAVNQMIQCSSNDFPPGGVHYTSKNRKKVRRGEGGYSLTGEFLADRLLWEAYGPRIYSRWKDRRGGSQKMSAKFDVQQYPFPTLTKSTLSGGDGGIGFENSNNFNSGIMMAENTMEIETWMKLVDMVRVLKVFTHIVDSGVRCGVIVEVTHDNVVGFHC